MALILNIDTALDMATISLAKDGDVFQSATNDRELDHAAWIQPAIQQLMYTSRQVLANLNAVGVSIGPGSYTGLRIGLSAAKGLCYALKIPLITIETLKVISFSAINDSGNDSGLLVADLFCPMIDARRMEVFTAVYDSNLNEVTEPQALILNQHSFEELLKGHKILFLGNGSMKFQGICQNAHAMFKNVALNPAALSILTYRNFIGNNFADIAYTEPLYLKEFFVKENEANKKGKIGSNS